MAKKVLPDGPEDARLYIVGEAPGKEEEEYGKPFIGNSGKLLTRILTSAGASRDLCRINNTVPYRPPGNKIEAWWPEKGLPNQTVQDGIQELLEDIRRVQPAVVLLLGGTPLRALFNHDSVLKWRGSHLEYQDATGQTFRCFPTLHPAYVLRQPSEQWTFSLDVKRAWARACNSSLWPTMDHSFLLRPSFESTCTTLLQLIARAEEGQLILACDIETRYRQIACVGIAWSRRDAICIPILCTERGDGYFLYHEEVEVVRLLRELLMHRHVRIVGQNWPYDAQYLARQWGIKAKLHLDTMTTHHVMFSSLRKGLDFLSSFYLEDHIYWKDDGKEWSKTMNEEILWRYNCLDAVRTFAVAEEELVALSKFNHKRTKHGTPFEIQHRVQEHLLLAMLRGVRVDTALRQSQDRSLTEAIENRKKWLAEVTGGSLKMANSPKQLAALFYEDMQISPVINYRVSPPRPTTNDEALEKIKRKEPLAIPICKSISEIRSIGIFKSVCEQELDYDNRIRCSYIIPGTVTYRLASREDAFGFGTNLQNVSTGANYEEGFFALPNLRKWFVPDEGMIMGDYDGAQADARVVAWEAEDEELKAIFRDPSADLHIENAKAIFGACSGKSDPRRQLAKTGVHAANYAVTPGVLAQHLGITVHEADKFLATWYGAHPRITKWHNRIRYEISSRRYVENAFGYRGYFFDRIEDVFKEALAWIPQSTVGIMVNIGICQVCENVPEAELLLQTHDSGNFQFPLQNKDDVNARIVKHMHVEIPYEDPLIIPIDSHLGTSWGACKGD